MTKQTKAVAITSVIWLVVFVLAARLQVELAKARWTNLRSDALYALSQYIDEIAAEQDAKQRVEMAARMGSQIKMAKDQHALVQGIYVVLDAHLKLKEKPIQSDVPNDAPAKEGARQH